MVRRRGLSALDIAMVCMMISVLLFLSVVVLTSKDGSPVENHAENYIEEVSAGKKYITVELPLSSDIEKLFKEEHYEMYIKLDNKNKVVYKKADKSLKEASGKDNNGN